MKDDEENIEAEEVEAWGEYFYYNNDQLLYEDANLTNNLTEEDIAAHEKYFQSIITPGDAPHENPFCEKCGGNTISLLFSNGKKTFIKCRKCAHHVSIIKE